MPATTIDCSSARSLRKATQRAAKLLKAGRLVVFPTETVYGVAASAASPQAIQRLRDVKNRADDQPFSVHLPEPDHIARYVDLENQPTLRRLVRKTLPGPVTFIVTVSDDVIVERLDQLGFAPDDHQRLYHQNTIGLRCPDQPVGQALLGCVDAPIVATSANQTGQPPATDAATAAAALGDAVDLVLDGGSARHARASTILRVDGSDVTVIREGVIDQRYLDKLLRRTVLFVCSGNTCRSPMAAALARTDLNDPRIDVISAGVFAGSGSPMSDDARRAVEQLGVDPGAHRSQALTPELLAQADVVFGMTQSHVAAAHQMSPASADKIKLLDADGADIDDPIGAGLDMYVECATRIRTLTQQRLNDLTW
ncbi:MAG: threonylcarbamoyl-AMP synthase [Planctomycetaceae bacterium]|nr:threonylcarbamoyl-AMP synthase [Planctomycetaceae bacterium]